MDTKNILSQLRAERDRIDQAIAALQTLDVAVGRGRRRRGLLDRLPARSGGVRAACGSGTGCPLP